MPVDAVQYCCGQNSNIGFSLVKESKVLKAALGVGVANLIHELNLLDMAIKAFNENLEKAQPLFSGRVVVRFSSKEKMRVDGEVYFDHKPCVGRMWKRRDGWVLNWVKKPDFDNLEDYRVGKKIGDDRIVVKLLRSLGAMLKQRESIVSQMKAIRKEISQSVQSLHYLHERKYAELFELAPQITVDWSKDADVHYRELRNAKEQRILNRESKNLETNGQ